MIIDAGHLVLASVLILCALGLIISVRGIAGIIAEGAAIRLDVATLIRGEHSSAENKKQIARIKKRGIGLRLKLASFTIALALAVNIVNSVPVYRIMTQTQRQTLFKSLWDRSAVLVESLAASASAYFYQGNTRALSLLPSHMNSVPEAIYVTITGFNPETIVFEDQVWATNDPNILRKIDSQMFHPGFSRIVDVISPHIPSLRAELNSQVLERMGSYQDEGQVTLQTLETRLDYYISEINNRVFSEPHFSLENLHIPDNRSFIFYKPIMHYQHSNDEFFWGLVRLEVSIAPILAEIAEGQRELLMANLLLALLAQTIGVIGALILSTIILHPVKQLLRHIEIIRDTEDKTKLSGLEIKMKSRDEIAVLGDTINEMTQGLVNAALAAGDLDIGKEVQKKFLPLNLDDGGNKLSYGFEDTRNLSLFCYYEGAKGVSGDYFDYIDLDDRYYAIIKCDVAGKGIPAAFIMIQVATMFLNFFRRWKPTEKGMHIEDMVYQINEFIETLAFKGRFAAFTLCLYDSETGLMRFCNAGDNIIRIFDSSEGRVVTHTLPQTPAAGAISNFEVEAKGGYRVQTLILDPGDILLLYTDGIDESKRKFRNAKFEEIFCSEGEPDTPHENHTVGQGYEELGTERVEGIINAVMNNQLYKLHKSHNPEGEDKFLQFDFSTCQGSTEDVIMAMVSIEKMFRCYKNPNAGKDDQVLVENKIDAFLHEHFLQYWQYCHNKQEIPNNSEYIYYTNVNEDEQYDDLTILGLKRK